MNSIKTMGMALGVIGVIFALSACGSSMRIKQGNEEFSIDADKYYEALTMQDDEEYAAEVRALDQQIEDEARAHIQALDDRKVLRKQGLLNDDDEDDDDEDDEDGPEVFYVH